MAINGGATGLLIEDYAVQFLRERAVRVLQRNFRCKFGEIDLVAQDQNVLVFIEVRFRKNANYGSAAETVDWHKQQKIIRSANWYLQRNGAQHNICRFDVVAITNTIAKPHVEWIKDAFHA